MPHEKNRKHKGHEKLHEENAGLEALVERCDSAVLRRQRVWRQLCNATYPFVRSVLQGVQRYLSNCQKRIAWCAKAPIHLLEAHCKLCKGTYPFVRSALQAMQRYLSICQKPVANCEHHSHYAVNQ